MAVDTEHLKHLYSSLDDEELVKMARGDLVPEARALIEKELASRRGVTSSGQAIARTEASAEIRRRGRPKEFVSGRTEPTFAFPALYSRAFFGEEALWRVYFIGVLPPLFVFGALERVAAANAPLAVIYLIMAISFSIWAVVSMWNCARNVTARYWWTGVLARFWAVVQALGAVAALIGLLR